MARLSSHTLSLSQALALAAELAAADAALPAIHIVAVGIDVPVLEVLDCLPE